MPTWRIPLTLVIHLGYTMINKEIMRGIFIPSTHFSQITFSTLRQCYTDQGKKHDTPSVYPQNICFLPKMLTTLRVTEVQGSLKSTRPIRRYKKGVRRQKAPQAITSSTKHYFDINLKLKLVYDFDNSWKSLLNSLTSNLLNSAIY